MALYNSTIDLVNDNGYTNVLKILSKTQILTSIKGHNSVANLRKMMLHNPNVDLAMIMCIHNLVISIKGNNSVANVQNIGFTVLP